MGNTAKIINCHTHIFVHKILPPHIGKSFMPWPLYLIFTTGFILRVAKLFYSEKPWSPFNEDFEFTYKRIQKGVYAYRAFIKRNALLNLLVMLFNAALIINALFFLFRGPLLTLFSVTELTRSWSLDIKNALIRYHVLLPDLHVFWKIIIIAFVFLFIRSGRKVLVGVFKNTFKLAGLWPDKKTIEFYKRYINIGRFANYKESHKIFSKLNHQYPENSGFILLPMDMAYMGAGSVSKAGHFLQQMDDLAKIKANHPHTAYPFLFIDPRRIAEEKDFLKYELDAASGTVTLGECVVKKYIADHKFNGFKIYPALGYYPFDEHLLILWKYAADHQLPIMTHAIRGTIFYRGTKKKAWGYHPVFEQRTGKPDAPPEPLLLPELENVNFINNFTHPLNYLCLLDERMLRKVVAQCKPDIQVFFGYIGPNEPMKHNLAHLKICMGHYGGEDEWAKFLEKDRYDYAQQIIRYPDRGINFLQDSDNLYTETKLENIWKYVDWYSIISSLMVQNKNVYADISYIVHDPVIIPLLKESLQNQALRKKILFGTDFYVVRNHKSEKEMLAALQTYLPEEDFDQIARINPLAYLESINFKVSP